MIKCKACGKDNEGNNWKCAACGTLLHEENNASKPKKPKNYIVLSVLMMLSLVPTGLVAFIYGLKVNSSYNAGEYGKAKEYSKKALVWNIVSFIIGLIVFLITIKYALQMFNQISPLMNKDLGELYR